jgi:hypothetical protein
MTILSLVFIGIFPSGSITLSGLTIWNWKFELLTPGGKTIAYVSGPTFVIVVPNAKSS